ncbi:2-hydroxyacid dehydrogenase [Micromonospora polyrhachis]|uniref:Phosphoglycerate dehydrogenase-like enzyme n=1 Tax=Micromonospora polyrhachis TaxID=1282883 RepID=A0A7W7SQ59_9ACTN|nr:2-hydroxyacid dehydrogenase [Micromonospora polyrhachis]MBB4958904.1 phosphoglycerate dehydrogenase-like enzyme [Micromonospora polyrhachis]
MRYLISHPDALAELGDLDVALYDGTQPVPANLNDVEFYAVPFGIIDPRFCEPIARMPRLKVVQTLTAGYDHVLPYLRPGVTLANGRGVHDTAVAELTVALILAARRRLPDFVQAKNESRWTPTWSTGLADARVLIVGYGSIGAAIERRLAGFEVEISRVARSARPGVQPISELPEMLPRADVVILATPLTPETEGLVDEDFLARMADGALLVNVARGRVVDTDALLAELNAGRLHAALDVTEPEPLPADHPLWSAPNLLISPHAGGLTAALAPRALRLLVDQVRRYAAGEPLANVVVAP